MRGHTLAFRCPLSRCSALSSKLPAYIRDHLLLEERRDKVRQLKAYSLLVTIHTFALWRKWQRNEKRTRCLSSSALLASKIRPLEATRASPLAMWHCASKRRGRFPRFTDDTRSRGRHGGQAWRSETNGRHRVRPPRDSLVRDSLRIPLRGDAVIATTRSTHATRMRGSLYRDRPVRSRHLPSDRGQNTRDAERRYGRAPSTTTPCVRACVHFRTFALPRACVAQRSHDHDAF